jgi:GDP/UDP-N,N'-diacetylbacillosamine 2-epimerase (hydrolysing)
MSSEVDRSIMIVTGSRAEYDILYPIGLNLRSHDNVDFGFVVTGTHLSPFHGMTIREIRADDMPIWAEVPCLMAADGLGARARSLGLLIGHLVTVIEQRNPIVVVACGDREDVLAAAIAASYMNTVFCHYSAGDEAFDGNIDNAVRHAASKLAHLMLVTHPAHKKLLEACGEDSERIHVVGNSGLDRIVDTPDLSDTYLSERLPYPLPEAPRALVIHHPTSLTVDSARDELEAIFEALERAGVNAMVSYPNSDAGNIELREVIDARRYQRVAGVHYNLDRLTFVNLVKRSQLIIGNSSMGIVEAPTYGVPVVNVGIRQRHRIAGRHVIWCRPDADEIEAAVRKVRDPEFLASLPNSNPYGDGRSGERIAELLASVDVTESLRAKRFDRLKEVLKP